MGALLTQFMNRYAYTDFHELNADWMIRTMMELINQVENFVSLNAIKYADPIQWNITSQYKKNTIVIDPLSGVAYISVKPVPMGVALTNTDYWTVVFDLSMFIVRAAKNFTNRYEADTTVTATFASSQGAWLVWGDVLYEVIIPNINAGDQYVVDSNIRHITMEEVCDALAQAIDAVDIKVGDLNDLTTSDTSSIVNAINSVLNDLNITIGDLANLTTTDKSSVVNAINEIDARLSNLTIKNAKDYGAVGDGIVDDSAALQSWLDDLTGDDLGYLPAGDYLIRTPLVAPNIDNLSIKGESNSKIIADFAIGDILTFGGSPRKRHLYLDGLWIDGAISHTSGAAIKIIGYANYNKIVNIKIGDYGSGTALLYDGIVFEYTHVCHFENFTINVNNEGLIVYGDPNNVYANSSDLFVNNGSILHCPVGLHLAGGFGGLYLDNVLIFGGKAGYRQNNTYCTLANREIFFSNTVCIDGCDNQLIDINESGNGSFIEINAFLSGAGYYAPAAEQPYACNIRIASAPYSTIIIANCVNKSSTQFGVFLNDSTARVYIDSTCVIRDCVVGVNNAASSAYIYCAAMFVNNSNTDFYGAYNPAESPFPQPVTPQNGDVRYNAGNIEYYNGSWTKLAGDCRVNIGNGQLSYWTGSTWQSMNTSNLAPRAGDVRYDIGTSAMQYYDGANWQNV